MAEHLEQTCFRPEHSCQEILQRLNSLRQGRHYCDLEVLVGDVTLSAHKLLLIATSEVMKTLLGECEGPTSLHLAGHRQEDVALLLDFLYTGQIDLNEARVAQVRSLALELQVDTLIRVCDAFALRTSAEKTDDPGEGSGKEGVQGCEAVSSGLQLASCQGLVKPLATEALSGGQLVSGDADTSQGQFVGLQCKEEPSSDQPTDIQDGLEDVDHSTSDLEDTSDHSPALEAAESGGEPVGVSPRKRTRQTRRRRDSHAHGELVTTPTKNDCEIKAESATSSNDVTESPLPTLAVGESAPPTRSGRGSGRGTYPRRNEEDSASYRCYLCQTPHEDRASLNAHMAVHLTEGRGRFLCQICSRLFPRAGHLARHAAVHARERNPQRELRCCSHCPRTFRRVCELKNHIRCHFNRRPVTCHVCSRTFPPGFKIARHMKIHSGEKPFMCDICSKMFQSASCLAKHQKIHRDASVAATRGRFTCATCSKSFRREAFYRAHVKLHATDSLRPHCDICQRTFSIGFRIKRHMRTHAAEKPFKCDLCPKTFSDRSNWRKHAAIHLGELRHQCSLCGKRFHSPSALKTHERIHTGERPFSCHLCPSTFASKSGLQYHARRHTGEKPHTCSFCMTSFGYLSNLRAHVRRVHTREKPFPCDLCEKAFCDGYGLNKHRKTHRPRRAETNPQEETVVGKDSVAHGIVTTPCTGK